MQTTAGDRRCPSGRVYISGTGRAGTTFLVQLLTELGLDTGFHPGIDGGSYFPIARAGLEKDIFDENGPSIIKSPHFCDHVDDVVRTGIAIRHVIIPVRDFETAAQSRRHVQFKTAGVLGSARVPGGLWGTKKTADQTSILEHKFSKLIEGLVRHDISMTFISFPRYVNDIGYLYTKLQPIFPSIDVNCFEDAFRKVARPELVHDFRPGGPVWPSGVGGYLDLTRTTLSAGLKMLRRSVIDKNIRRLRRLGARTISWWG